MSRSRYILIKKGSPEVNMLTKCDNKALLLLTSLDIWHHLSIFFSTSLDISHQSSCYFYDKWKQNLPASWHFHLFPAAEVTKVRLTTDGQIQQWNELLKSEDMTDYQVRKLLCMSYSRFSKLVLKNVHEATASRVWIRSARRPDRKKGQVTKHGILLYSSATALLYI